MKVLKKVTPKGGIAKTPIEILQRSKDMLSDEAHWIQGGMFCPLSTEEEHQADTDQERYDVVVAEIMRNGLCGSGWGVCAVGAVSMFTGLNAVVEITDEFFNVKENKYELKTVRQIQSLVSEVGNPVRESEPPAVRVKRYKEAVDALNAATRQRVDEGAIHFEYISYEDVNVWSVNDANDGSSVVFNNGLTPHAAVLDIFDLAIANLAGAK